MATQMITLPEADPSEKAVHIRVDGPIPPPAFIKIVDASEATDTYLPIEAFKALLADFKAVKQHLEGGPWSFADTAIRRHEEDIAKAEGKWPAPAWQRKRRERK